VSGVLLLGVPPSPAAADNPAQSAPIARFQKVDDRLYRGAQPDEEGFRYLRSLGIRTVINLREEHYAVRLREQQVVESLGMKYVHVPVTVGNFFNRSPRIPEAAVRAFFDTLDSTESGAVFVHCRRGADRTGALVGLYRIARHHWDPSRAYREAREIGMRYWHKGLKRQIEEFGREQLHAPRALAPSF
jgi:protein tyrosine phosphatase (PTP) superfamily phosphohydrolase (DUF442 family)